MEVSLTFHHNRKIMTQKPMASNSLAEKELDKAQKQLDAFDKSVKDMTLDRMNAAPKEEQPSQVNLSRKDIENSKDIYIKPRRNIGSREKFNENFREEYNFAKEYVHIIAENKELSGENLEFWTKPYAGMPAEEWVVPTNKPVWVPRYVAEQIKRKRYHRMKMEQTSLSGSDGNGQYYGTMAVDTIVQRLDANPVSKQRSIFTGMNNF